MPIYEYRCGKCGNVFEEWTRSFDSPEHEPCPQCGGDSVRIVSNTSFVLKGGGWYVTEYGNHKKTDHESGAGAPGEGKAADASQDTAPTAAGETAAESAPVKEAPKETPKETAKSGEGKNNAGNANSTAAA